MERDRTARVVANPTVNGRSFDASRRLIAEGARLVGYRGRTVTPIYASERRGVQPSQGAPIALREAPIERTAAVLEAICVNSAQARRMSSARVKPQLREGRRWIAELVA